MAVVTHSGVVGQVTRVTSRFSEIQVVLSPESGISAFVQRTRSHGIISGGIGRNRCLLKYIESTEQPRAGDFVVTSGHDRIFPKGLLIGHIIQTERQAHELLQSVVIETAVDFSRLEEVLILKSQDKALLDKDFQDDLVPPDLPQSSPQPPASLPTPLPSPTPFPSLSPVP
ncbi:rod shape-determining protein MreC, partial [bacterium]|nr:rod shape-determining protein MreC [candidate division CSSED10-310 bacterium]